MNAKSVEDLVRSQIGDAWEVQNSHGVNLRKSLVKPTQIIIIERNICNGRSSDGIVQGWL